MLPAPMRALGALDYWEERHRALPPLLAVGHGRVGLPFNAWMYRVRRHVFHQSAPELLGDRRDVSVLDVDSGTGFYADLWRELGVRDITASDAAAEAVARLRARGVAPSVLRLDVAGPRDRLPSRRFDAVSAFDVLFHLTDEESYARAIANLAALVRSGGLLLLSENLRPDGDRRVSDTQTDRSAARTLALLEAAGFDLLSRRPMFVLMNDPQNAGGVAHRAWWSALCALLARVPAAGVGLGPLLYPLERRLVGREGAGPSTEMLACRRR